MDSHSHGHRADPLDTLYKIIVRADPTDKDSDVFDKLNLSFYGDWRLYTQSSVSRMNETGGVQVMFLAFDSLVEDVAHIDHTLSFVSENVISFTELIDDAPCLYRVPDYPPPTFVQRLKQRTGAAWRAFWATPDDEQHEAAAWRALEYLTGRGE